MRIATMMLTSIPTATLAIMAMTCVRPIEVCDGSTVAVSVLGLGLSGSRTAVELGKAWVAAVVELSMNSGGVDCRMVAVNPGGSTGRGLPGRRWTSGLCTKHPTRAAGSRLSLHPRLDGIPKASGKYKGSACVAASR